MDVSRRGFGHSRQGHLGKTHSLHMHVVPGVLGVQTDQTQITQGRHDKTTGVDGFTGVQGMEAAGCEFMSTRHKGIDPIT
jgi:hypothetical protein